MEDNNEIWSEKGKIDLGDGVISVKLIDSGPEKVKVIKFIREYTGLGLKESKSIVDNAPEIFLENISIDGAKKVINAFQEIGAKVEQINCVNKLPPSQYIDAEYMTDVSEEENYDQNKFKLFNQCLDISDGRKVTAEVRQFANNLAVEASSEYRSYYKSFGDIDTVIKKTPDTVISILLDKADQCVNFFIDKGIYSISSKDIIGKVQSICFDSIFNSLEDWYENTISDQKEKERYRAIRKQSRNRWSGAGFGLNGAVKAATQAATLNALSGMGHSVVNLVGNTFTSLGAAMSKGAKYRDAETVNNICSAIYVDVFRWNGVLQLLMYSVGYEIEHITEEDERKACNIFNNLKKVMGNYNMEEQQYSMAFSLFELNPTELEYYSYCLNNFPAEQIELYRLATYMNLDISEYLEEALYSYLNSFDFSNEESAKKVRMLIQKRQSIFGLEESKALNKIDEILKAYDLAARTYLDVVYDSREERLKAESDYLILEERFSDIVLSQADESKCNEFQSQLIDNNDNFTSEIVEVFIQRIKNRIIDIWREEDESILISIFMNTDILNQQTIENSIIEIENAGRTQDKEKYIRLLKLFNEKDLELIKKGIEAKENQNKKKGILGFIQSTFNEIPIQRGNNAWDKLTLKGTIVHPYLQKIKDGSVLYEAFDNNNLKRCSKCSNWMPEDAIFCGNCGNKF